MASSIPSQARAVDPFASYSSNTVNTLTRMLTYGENCIATPLSCDVSLDSTSNTQVVLGPGFVYQSDVWIHLSANHIVDFTDPDHYYLYGTGYDEEGYYYIVLEYTYVKSRPAPQAKALIVKPSQIAAYNPGGSWLFLKAVKVEGSAPSRHVVSVHNFDPLNPENHRECVLTFAGGVAELPTHVPIQDTGRFIYDFEDNDFYFGYSNKWVSLTSLSGSIYARDTSGFNEGSLVYIDSAGDIQLGISTLRNKTSDGVITRTGTDGYIQTSGYVESVLVESGVNMQVGELVYLSLFDAGKITNQQTPQFTGRCVGIVDSTTVNIIYHRGDPLSSELEIVTATLSSGGWISDSGIYYQDITASNMIMEDSSVQVRDTSTMKVILPYEIEFIPLDNKVRIWMSVNTVDLDVVIIGPSIYN